MLTRILSRRAEHWREYHAVAATPSAGTIIPVRSKRLHRTRFLYEITRELPAVFTVLVAAGSALRREHDAAGYVLAAAEVIAGACVLVVIALEARHLFGRQGEHPKTAPHSSPRVDASSLAAAALGYVEAWHHARVVGHFKLFSPYIVGATTSLLVARFKNRPASKPTRRRRLHVCVTPAGISYIAGPRRRWRAKWDEVAAVEHERGELAVRLNDGRRHVLRADDLLDGESVLAESRAAIARHAPHVLAGVGGTTGSGPDVGAHTVGPNAAI